ncbi:MAG: DUF805 domain-containing protein [Asticcacaulis sp.]
MSLQLMFQPLRKYADFHGRARRSEYWLFMLFQFVVFTVVQTILMSMMLSSFTAFDATSNTLPDAVDLSGLAVLSNMVSLISIVFLIPNLAVSVRRLHDTNRTGWWLVMPTGVFIAGLTLFLILNLNRIIDALNSTSPSEAAIFSIVGQAVALIWLPTIIAGLVVFIFTVLEGTKGPNKYGADPKAPDMTVTPSSEADTPT